MSSAFVSLSRRGRGNCEKCGHVHDLVGLKSNGEEYDLCRDCATRVQARRAR